MWRWGLSSRSRRRVGTEKITCRRVRRCPLRGDPRRGVNRRAVLPTQRKIIDVSASQTLMRSGGDTRVAFEGGRMAFSLESERILQAAVAGIPRVAMTIAQIPTAFRERALQAVARSYQQTVRELSHTEADAQIWISAVMLRLRSNVTEQRKKLRSLTDGRFRQNTARPDA